MRTLVAIKSCWSHKDRRDACRQTWLQDSVLLSWADYWFITGEHKPLRYFADTCEILNGENDIKSFHVKDDFKNIAPKILCIVRFALARGYDFAVIADDDTYIVPERLREAVEFAHAYGDDYIGFRREDSGSWGSSCYMQGSCFILSRRAMEILSEDADRRLVDGIPDDVAVGQALDGHVNYKHSAFFWPGPSPASITSDNYLISTHKCGSAYQSMGSVHKRWQDSHA